MAAIPQILERILTRKEEEIARLSRRGITAPDCEIPLRRGFARALTSQPGVAIIAEVKKASPSKGVIAADFDPVRIAKAYLAGGASAVSVLTDVDFFQGSLDYLLAVRNTVDLPVLRKDFIIHSLQVQESSLYGADCILLIAAALDAELLRDLHQQAEELGMDVLVEVHDEAELDTVLATGARLIGVNNRNLRDFSMDVETSFRLRERMPEDILMVSESGLKGREDIFRLDAAGINAALIGESLMRAADQEQALRDFCA